MYPRAKAFGIVLHNERILVQEYLTESEAYYRPLGGSIEFGEKSDETVIREFKEELNEQVEITTYLGCLENIFYANEEIGHEIIQLYSLHFVDTSLYEIKTIPITTFLNQEKVLYPNGLTKFVATKRKDGIL
ncbi:DNA mismatch repair protein MutT [Bacillus pseudomycoides]|uniref:NUDIX hydrolase n=1 Tax=Bacillus pseudomycoides TaxID=64104 RepID=UPI000BEBA4CD|nr:NUDIX domain-containing protein [Bacillus pseudomycoides]PDX98446.1 DNA mismatch repair protein MutT [Bacillus pseudomycoides]PEK77655.1 DNA mismatch repair protein MutT [Bacillus pseudomycoides]PEN04306.1 DNA mismatch repair protein MutT [Bacillus pseudomycoides]PGB92353.1 DNA mismatch repair protein MutT [Bacillus pseudomycoides]PHE58540.1 DNA mismatch repair protein MutT [Bacillus pseudomycoides]